MLSHCWIFLSWCCTHDSWRFIRLYPSFQREFEQVVKPSWVSQERRHVWLGEAWWIPYPIEKKELRLGTYRKSIRIWYTLFLSLSLSLPVPIAVSWHCGYSKMDFPIHHDICGKFFPGCPENHLQKTANERRHVDVSREPCLGDLSTTALEAVKATKCSWIAWPTDKLTDCQCLKQRCDESYADVWGYLETAMQHVHCFSVGASSGSC